MDLNRIAWRKASYSSGNGGNCVEVGIAWRKASYSTGNGGDCVEVGVAWRKASYSTGNGGNCVEVRNDPRIIAVRDSKNLDGPKLAFSREGWQRFTLAVKSGADRA